MAQEIANKTVLQAQYPSTVWNAIGQVVSVDVSEATAAKIDTTLLSATASYKTNVKGDVEAGDVTFTLRMDPALGDHKNLGTLLGLVDSAAYKNWRVVHPTTTKIVGPFSAALGGLGSTYERDSMIEGTATLFVSGTPGFAAT